MILKYEEMKLAEDNGRLLFEEIVEKIPEISITVLDDDFDDIEQDRNRKNTNEFAPNYIISYGIEDSYNLFNKHIKLFETDFIKYLEPKLTERSKNVLIEIETHLVTRVNQVYQSEK